MTNEDNDTIIARVDERTKAIQNEITQLRDEMKNSAEVLADQVKNTAATLAEKTRDIDYRFSNRMNDLQTQLNDVRSTYVSRIEYTPTKIIVWGMIGLIVVGVASALFSGVIHGPPARTEIINTQERAK